MFAIGQTGFLRVGTKLRQKYEALPRQNAGASVAHCFKPRQVHKPPLEAISAFRLWIQLLQTKGEWLHEYGPRKAF